MLTHLDHNRRSRWLRVPLLAVLLTATSLAMSPAIASAAPGDAKPLLLVKSTAQPTAGPGDTIQYVVNYSCSNNEQGGDGCDGSVFADPLPKFTDIYGNSVPVEFVSASGSASVWPAGFSVNATDPMNPVVTSTAGPWPPGNSGSIFITVRVPRGVVPVAPQNLTNTAHVTDPESPLYVDDSTTATTVISATAPSWTISKSGPASTRMNRNAVWTVSVCGPATSALFPLYTITDSLPPGVQFVSAASGGTYADDNVLPAAPDATSDGAGVVTWTFDATNRPPLGSDGCFRMAVTGRFPTGYVDPSSTDHPNDDNVGDAKKIDSATGVGQATPGGPTIGLGTALWTTTLIGATFGLGDGGTTKRFTDTAGADNYYTLVGDTGRFNLAGSIDSDLPADSFVITDGTWALAGGSPASGTGLPPSFLPTAITPGTWNAPITATIEGSDDGFATAPAVIATGVASGAAQIPLPTPYRSIRWVWGGAPDSVPGDFAATGLQIVGTIGSPSGTLGLYTNTSTLTATRGNETVTAAASDSYVIETPLPHPSIAKSVSSASRQPGQTTTYTLRVSNSADATGSLPNPYVEDCVPDYFTIQGAPTLGAGWSVGAPLPSCSAGQTPLRFDFAGTLAPGAQTTTVIYTVLVDGDQPGPITPPGTYPNTAFVKPAGGGAFAHCGNTNPSCGDKATVTIQPVVELNSQKCVQGELDDYFRPSPGCEVDPGGAIVAAQTLPGGLMDWELRLRNSGNTDATNVEFIDLFPRVGDTAVLSATNGVLNPRFSEYQPYLVSEIVAPAGWTVSYSTSTNPCRPEVGGVNNPGTDCEVPSWVSSPPPFLDLPTYRSIKLSYSGVLGMGDTATFEWSTRAPVLDPSYDQGGTSGTDPYEFLAGCTAQTPRTDPTHCPRAVNSFAYGADATNLPQGVPQPTRLFAEPPQVEVRVTAPPTPNGVGDRVWFDRDFDGLQGADVSPTGEPGVPGVYVELYKFDPIFPGGRYDFVAYTFTDANGNYLFAGGRDGLSDGTYQLRFTPPPGYYVSPQDQSGGPDDQGAPAPGTNPGTNTNDDSDVSRAASGAGPHGPYHLTTDIELGDNDNSLLGTPNEGELDPTWDMGIWSPLPSIQVAKVTKDTAWPDVQAGDGVSILQGRPVTWIYTVTNTGNTRLEDVSLADDGGPGASFAVSSCAITSPGANVDGLLSSATAPMALNRGAVMRCTATGTAGAVNYANDAAVAGTPVLDDGAPVNVPPVPVMDSDPSSYVSGKYDLALAKTVGTLNLVTGNVDFTIRERNEGTVASGAYQVTDVLPTGMSLVGSANPAQTSIVGNTIVWDRPSMPPGADRTITFTAHIDSYLARPYRNYAEISDDSADLVVTGGVSTPTTDRDSTPDADIANDNAGNGVALGNGYGPVGTPDPQVDNADITQAGSRLFPNSGDDPKDGEDDADIADVSPTITYDLALAKVASNGPVGLGEDPTFQVRVYNQGNVPSGAVTVRDQVPTGLTFTTTGSTSGCVAGAGNTVTCTLASIDPGSSTVLTLVTTVDGTPADYSTAPWRNWAEIASDSAQTLYGVDDIDSSPEDGQLDGIGEDSTLPGDAYVGVETAGPSYAPPTGTDEDDNDDAVMATSVRYDLALIKTVADIDPGTGLMDLTIAVTNQGTVASGAYSVRDVLPAGLDVESASLSPDASTVTGTTALGRVIAWNDQPSLDPGATATFTYTARITDYRERPFRNIAEITDDSVAELYGITDADSTPDTDTTNDGSYGTIGSSPIDNTSIDDAGVIGGDPQDDADIADAIVTVDYDLALAKIADATLVNQDGTITYTITVRNQGNVPSGVFTVTDTMPAGLGFVSSPDGGVYDNSGSRATVTFTGSGLAPGDDATFRWTANVTDVNQRPFRNYAEISGDSGRSLYDVDDSDSTPNADITDDGDYGTQGSPSAIDNASIDDAGVIGGDPEDDADIADVDLQGLVYDLALSKVVDAPTATLGDVVTFTITVQNQGNLDSKPIIVTDWLPTGLEIVDLGGGVANVDGTIDWVIDNIPVGESVTRTLTARVADVTKGPFRNIAEITADGADFYDVNVGNIVDVEDIDSTPDADRTNDGAYGPVTDPGAIDNVGPDAIDAAGVDPDPSDDADIADIALDVVYDLALVKTGPPTMSPLGTATFTIQVLNQGNVPSGPFDVRDAVPAGMEAVAASDAGSLDTPTTAVTWTGLPSIDPGETATLTVEMRIDDLTQRPFLNIAEISAGSSSLYDVPARDDEPGRPATPAVSVLDSDSTPDSNPLDDAVIDQVELPDTQYNDPDVDQDDHDVAAVTTEVVYDLALVKTVDAPTIAYDGTVAFTVTVANQGNVPSVQATVVDDLPPGTTFVSASDGGTPNAEGTAVTWELGDLAPGAEQQLTLTVRPTDLTQRPFRNVAEITADGADTYIAPGDVTTDVDSTPGDVESSTADNTTLDEAGGPGDIGFDDEDVAVFDVPVVYDLALVKTLPAGQSYLQGSAIRFEIRVRNQGNVPSGPYSVQDVIPPGMSFVSASANGAVGASGTVAWNDLTSLAPGETAVLTVVLRLDDVTLPRYRNVAEITADGAGDYSTPTVVVTDKDSVPDLDPNNDALVDTDDVSIDQVPGDEDDHDIAELDVSLVTAANTAAPSGPLPWTGADAQRLAELGLLTVLAGVSVAAAGRRRRIALQAAPDRRTVR